MNIPYKACHKKILLDPPLKVTMLKQSYMGWVIYNGMEHHNIKHGKECNFIVRSYMHTYI